MNPDNRNRYYCHYYHTNQNCWAGKNCRFIHGDIMNYCPNGRSCPVKVYHNEPTSTPPSSSRHRHRSRERDHSSRDSHRRSYRQNTPSRSNSKGKEKKEKEIIIRTENKQFFEDLPDEIKQILNRKYSKNQEATNFLINYYKMFQDMQQFLPIYNRMFPKTELDLMFIVDCTGSMSSWINAVKQEISGILAAIKFAYQASVIRVSFAGYRDYVDKERYVILDFTDDLTKFKAFVSKVSASGGGDEPEDLAGGFQKANSQSWQYQAKQVVLITDAPAHGKEYHGQDQFYDNHINGDPSGIDLKEEFRILIRKGVQLHVVEITGSTKIMYQKFSDYHKEFSNSPLQILKLGNSTNGFGNAITNAASKTLSASYTRTTKDDPQNAFNKALKILQEQNTEYGPLFLDRYNIKSKSKRSEKRVSDQEISDDEEENKNEMKGEDKQKQITTLHYETKPSSQYRDLKENKSYQATCHTYFIVQDQGVPIDWKKPLVQNSSIQTSLKIDTDPFAEGAMRYAFYAYDDFLNQKLVAKQSKIQFSQNIEKNKEEIVKELEAQFICQHLVNMFNDQVSEYVVDTSNLKNFVHTFIYEINHPDVPYKYYSVENYLEGDYVKFNNNSGWCNFKFDESGLLSQALSHFSYQRTEGYLMIVDLQGVGNMLTDPQIHCLDTNRFGQGNLGYQGMFKFFLNHQCNQYCEDLNLINPTKHNVPSSMTFFSKEIEQPINSNKEVSSMCDLCKNPFHTTAGYVYNQRVKCQEKYCDSCDQKKKQSMKKGTCETCRAGFTSSVYWFLMKRTDFPTLCSSCRKERRNKLREQLVKNDSI